MTWGRVAGWIFYIIVLIIVGIALVGLAPAWVIALIIVLMFLFGFAFTDLTAWLAGKIFGFGTCALRTQYVLKDYCEGSCPPGQSCTVTATRPYGPGGFLGTQASACGCGATVGGGTGTIGGIGSGAGTSGPDGEE